MEKPFRFITDNYRFFLQFLLVLTFLLVIVLFGQIYDQSQLFLRIWGAKPENLATENEPICVEGTPRLENFSDSQSFEKEVFAILEDEFFLPNLLYAEISWTHHRTASEYSETILDNNEKIIRPFHLISSGKKYKLEKIPRNLIFPRELRDLPAGSLRAFSASSSHVLLNVFGGKTISIYAARSKVESDIRYLEGASGTPIIMANISRNFLLNWFYGIFTLEILIILLFIFSFFSSPQIRFFAQEAGVGTLKSEYERNPHRYFVFDLTGGLEETAVGGFFWYAFFFAIIFYFVQGFSSFTQDLVLSLLILGVVWFFRFAKNVEFFHVVDIEARKVFEISKGWGPTLEKEISSLDEFELSMKEFEDDGGVKSFALVGKTPQIPQFLLTDNFMHEPTVVGLLESFKEFKAC